MPGCTTGGTDTPASGPSTSITSRAMSIQARYCSTPATPLPASLPASSANGCSEDSMISAVLPVFSVSTARLIDWPYRMSIM